MDSRDPTRSHAGLARDHALRRASTLSKWIGVGAVTLTGALAGFVAQAKPGHSTTPSESSRAPRAPRTSSSPRPHASVTPSPSLAPPPAPPAPAPGSSGTVSGGS